MIVAPCVLLSVGYAPHLAAPPVDVPLHELPRACVYAIGGEATSARRRPA